MLTRKAVEDAVTQGSRWPCFYDKHERRCPENWPDDQSEWCGVCVSTETLLRPLAEYWLETHPVCPECGGRGQFDEIKDDLKCDTCRGLGYLDKLAVVTPDKGAHLGLVGTNESNRAGRELNGGRCENDAC